MSPFETFLPKYLGLESFECRIDGQEGDPKLHKITPFAKGIKRMRHLKSLLLFADDNYIEDSMNLLDTIVQDEKLEFIFIFLMKNNITSLSRKVGVTKQNIKLMNATINYSFNKITSIEPIMSIIQ